MKNNLDAITELSERLTQQASALNNQTANTVEQINHANEWIGRALDLLAKKKEHITSAIESAQAEITDVINKLNNDLNQVREYNNELINKLKGEVHASTDQH